MMCVRGWRRLIWLVMALAISWSSSGFGQTAPSWLAHDMRRPRPRIVTPGNLNLPVAPPADAVVLFDGSDLSQWRNLDGGPPRWELRDDYMVSTPDGGHLMSAQPFGDIQLHVEWAAPLPAEGQSQKRGNSGIYLMLKYEIQILDSFENDTYPDGQAAAVYGQYPPLVNANLPPGEWQSFDIVFRRPRFHPDKSLAAPARVTLIHNGILVQDSVELLGPTNWLQRSPYERHPDRLPIGLQHHGNPVLFRNIWLRELRETKEPGPPQTAPAPAVNLLPAELERYAGRYELADGRYYLVDVNKGQLRAEFNPGLPIDLVPESRETFRLRWTAAKVTFQFDAAGEPRAMTIHIGGEQRLATRVTE